MTSSADTPASTYFDGRLVDPVPVKRDLFDAGATSGRSRIGYGDLLLANPDGALDGLLNYGWDGRAVTVYKGVAGAAFPASFDVVFAGTAQQCVTPDADTVAIKLRDNQADLETPFQSNKYLGTNVLPDGLEGTEDDIKGKPKPVVIGKALNVPAVCVNTSKLIYQVNDGPIGSLDAVYDSGIRIVGAPIIERDSGQGGLAGALAAGNGIFVAVGTSLRTSPDAFTWTTRTHGFGSNGMFCAKFANGLFVVGGQNKTLATSSDGITWTMRTLPAGWGASDDVRAIAYGNGTWLVVGDSGSAATSTDNGVTWTQRTVGHGAVTLLAVAFGAGAFVVPATGSSNVARSVDGITWTMYPVHTSYTTGGDIVFGGRRFITGGGAPIAFYQSKDGIGWAPLSNKPGAATGALRYANNRFFCLCTSGLLFESLDGDSWSKTAAVSTSQIWTDIVFLDSAGMYLGSSNDGTTPTNFYAPAALSYGSVADLQNDILAPVAGSMGAYLAGGMFRLGSPPAGQVTADVSQGSSASNRTQAQLFAAVLQRAGKSAGTAAGNYLAADLTALDALDHSERGGWYGDDVTFADVLDEVTSPGAWWGIDRQGRYRIAQFRAPEGPPTFSITANDMDGPPRRVTLPKDDGKGVPPYRSIVRYQRNYTVQRGTQLAGAVGDDRRSFLGAEWREVVAEDGAVRERNLLAAEARYDSLLADSADASAEAMRLQVLRGVLRHVYDVTVKLSDFATVDLGDVGTLTHSRYGLSAGVAVRVIGLNPDGRRDRVTIRLFGPADPTSLLRGPVPTLTGRGYVGGVGTGSVAARLPKLTGTGTVA